MLDLFGAAWGFAAIFIVVFVMPFLFGVVLGFNVIVDRPFLLFFITFVIQVISGISGHIGEGNSVESFFRDEYFYLLPMGVGPALLLLAGSSFGRWIARKWFGIIPVVEPAVAVARRFYTGKGLPSTEESQKVKRLAETINAITPVLTFLATIVGAFLTYLGTRH